MKVRKMRLLRQKHGITRPELGKACNLSPQRISEIELNVGGITQATEQKLQQGFRNIVAQRSASLIALSDDLSRYGDSLFDAVEETTYEL